MVSNSKYKPKLTFIHIGERIKVGNDGKFYTDGSYNDKVWPRYLNHFGKINFIVRENKAPLPQNSLRKQFNALPSDQITPVILDDIQGNILAFLSFKSRYNNFCKISNAIKDADYVIVRVPSFYSLVIYFLLVRYKKPFLVEVVGCAWDSLFNYSFLGKVIAPFEFLKMKFFVARAKYTLYVSSFFLQKRYPSRNARTIACSNVTLGSAQSDSVLQARLRKIDTLSERHRVTIGTAANVGVPYKGHEYVIKAIPSIVKKGINIHYVMAGAGDQLRLINIAKEYNVNDRVHFTGAIPHDRMGQWFSELDLYIQPSCQEGVPRAVVEAMSFALPAIVTDAGGSAELVDPADVIKKRSVRNIEDRIVYMLSEEEKMKACASRNFAKSKEYSLSILDNRRSNFFKEFIRDGKK